MTSTLVLWHLNNSFGVIAPTQRHEDVNETALMHKNGVIAPSQRHEDVNPVHFNVI